VRCQFPRHGLLTRNPPPAPPAVRSARTRSPLHRQPAPRVAQSLPRSLFGRLYLAILYLAFLGIGVNPEPPTQNRQPKTYAAAAVGRTSGLGIPLFVWQERARCVDVKDRGPRAFGKAGNTPWTVGQRELRPQRPYVICAWPLPQIPNPRTCLLLLTAAYRRCQLRFGDRPLKCCPRC